MHVDVPEGNQAGCYAVQFILKSPAFLLELADYRLHQCFWHEAILSLANWTKTFLRKVLPREKPVKVPVPRSMVGEESELRIQATHSLINSSPQKLLAWHCLNFTRPDNGYRTTQYQFGIKSPDIRALPILPREWPFESPELDGQRVVQREKAKCGIFENYLMACSAVPNNQPYRYVRDLDPANPDRELWYAWFR